MAATIILTKSSYIERGPWCTISMDSRTCEMDLDLALGSAWIKVPSQWASIVKHVRGAQHASIPATSAFWVRRRCQCRAHRTFFRHHFLRPFQKHLHVRIATTSASGHWGIPCRGHACFPPTYLARAEGRVWCQPCLSAEVKIVPAFEPASHIKSPHVWMMGVKSTSRIKLI